VNDDFEILWKETVMTYFIVLHWHGEGESAELLISGISHTKLTPGSGLHDRGPGFRLLAGVGNIFFSTASRPSLGHTQPPVQWVPGALWG